MTVSGTTTTIDTTTLTVEDKNIELGKVSTPTDTTADQGGITLLGATNKTFQWLDATDSWTSSEHIALPDNKKLQLGNSQDLELYHNGNHSFIDNKTGQLYIRSPQDIIIAVNNTEVGANIIDNGAVELFFDGSKKFETSSDGIAITGAVRLIGTATGFLAGKAHPTLYRTASTSGSYPFDGFGHLIIQSRNDGANRDIIFATGTNSAKLNRITSDGHLDVFGDNQKIRLGASQDLQLFHDGGTSRIISDSHALFINTTTFVLKNAAFNEDMITAASDGAVSLYFDGSKKFETTNQGIKVVGAIRVGNGVDMRIMNDNGQETHANFINNGAVELYHDGSKKFETTSTGATVTTTSAANSIKNITTSTSAPSGGSDGDLWFTYIA